MYEGKGQEEDGEAVGTQIRACTGLALYWQKVLLGNGFYLPFSEWHS